MTNKVKISKIVLKIDYMPQIMTKSHKNAYSRRLFITNAILKEIDKI